MVMRKPEKEICSTSKTTVFAPVARFFPLPSLHEHNVKFPCARQTKVGFPRIQLQEHSPTFDILRASE